MISNGVMEWWSIGAFSTAPTLHYSMISLVLSSKQELYSRQRVSIGPGNPGRFIGMMNMMTCQFRAICDQFKCRRRLPGPAEPEPIGGECRTLNFNRTADRQVLVRFNVHSKFKVSPLNHAKRPPNGVKIRAETTDFCVYE